MLEGGADEFEGAVKQVGGFLTGHADFADDGIGDFSPGNGLVAHVPICLS